MLIKQPIKYAAKSKSVNAVLISAITAMGLSSNAFANDLSKEERIDVAVKVADLQSEDGIEKVYRKLERAAKSACRPSSSFQYAQSKIEACEADLMEQFIESLDHAEVAKLYAVKAG